MSRTARIDFTYGGVKFKKGDQVPESIAAPLRRFGGMYLDDDSQQMDQDPCVRCGPPYGFGCRHAAPTWGAGVVAT